MKHVIYTYNWLFWVLVHVNVLHELTYLERLNFYSQCLRPSHSFIVVRTTLNFTIKKYFEQSEF